MAENFDLIFGQNASQQYAWNDSDYQDGWETIGNIPPTAAQFDALQRRADTKAQELNTRLETVEKSIAGGGGQKREADTAYAVGDVVSYDGLPMDWVLVCIVGGTSGSADITLPSPRVEGARILDGTVTWALRKIATYGGVGYRQSSTACPTGSIAFSTALPAGWYLEAATGGTTSASDLVIITPAVGGTVTDGTVVWTIRKVADTTDATTTTHGLMSASDKTKLIGIEANANNYSLPTASASVKGGIKIGSGLSMSGETLNNAYSLPTASSSTLGGVKTGSNITNNGGTISLTKTNVTSALGYTPPTTNTTYNTGTASYSGTTKLYTVVGDNTDGTMTQKAIKDIIGNGRLTDSYYNATTGDWYRVYSDGWIEQGGLYKSTATEEAIINLLKPMADTLYTVTRCNGVYNTTAGAGGSLAGRFFGVYNLTTTSFKASTIIGGYNVEDFAWSVCGKMATS